MVATAEPEVTERVRAAIARPPLPSIAERMDEGRQLRKQVPRSSHAGWSPPADRPDPLDLLLEQDKNREQDLIPIRYGRMLVSPFAFYRGSAVVMARDLAATPTSGLHVQACGDAHLSNFGTFATPERNQVFDINDFDETLPAPWEWDVKRLAASVIVAGRANGHKAADSAEAAAAAVRSYRERMTEFASMGHLAVWYNRISGADIAAVVPPKVSRNVQRGLLNATHRDHLQVFQKMVSAEGGHLRMVDDPPLVVHIDDAELEERLRTVARTYRSSIRDDLRALLSRYTFVDTARKVVGVGSVGTRCYLVLMQGNHDEDPLFLQIKEANASVLEPYAGKSTYANHGQRVVRGQQYVQAASDIFLGWGRGLYGIDFYVRQLRDMKASIDVALLAPDRMVLYAEMCGWALARAHARSADAARISGYLGNGPAFDDAIVNFAIAYADQTERDHAALVAAVKSGRIKAITGR
jgi:uncharacterized protein (DUF2252 family)